MRFPKDACFFKDEPVLEVTAPIIEGQLMESFVINAINLQVTIATKVSRCVYAARGRNVVDFSLRRTQGIDAGLARTSNVLAGKMYQIPVSGTMDHSFITSFKDEIDAFRAFAQAFGDQAVLLIDTYDTVAGAEKAVEVAREMAQKGRQLKGVRGWTNPWMIFGSILKMNSASSAMTSRPSKIPRSFLLKSARRWQNCRAG